MKETLKFFASAEDADCRLDKFLAARIQHLSRMRIADLLEQGACTVNSNPSPAGYHLKAGDHIAFTFANEPSGATTPEHIPLDILYEDSHIIVVNKSAGMLVHPTHGVKSGTLSNALAYHLNRLRNADCEMRIEESGALSFQAQSQNLQSQISNPQSEIRIPQFTRPGLVHRLDRDTSGLMVVAKEQRALSVLSGHFHRRLVEKRYLALMHGVVNQDEMTIDAPIGRRADLKPKWRVLAEGREARTRLRVIERRECMTLAELEPVTGRTNQLRIHTAHINHPIVGDRLHGINDNAPRLCLHASRLAFHHPTNGEWMEFTSSLPQEIASIFDAAR